MKVILFENKKELILFLGPYFLEEGNLQGSHFHPFIVELKLELKSN